MSASLSPPSQQTTEVLAKIEALGVRMRTVRSEIARIIFGQEEVVEQTLVTLLCRRACPARRRARARQDQAGRDAGRPCSASPPSGCSSRPDLMPADILGSEVLEETRRPAELPLRARPGLLPVADGRRDQPRKPAHAIGAAPGDAGAQVAVGGVEHALPRPFTSWRPRTRSSRKALPLPEAQLDRFLWRSGPLPRSRAERTMLLATTGAEEARPVPVLAGESLLMAQALVRRIPVGESVLEAILALVRGGRPETANTRRYAAMSPGVRARAPPGPDAGLPGARAARRPARAERRRRHRACPPGAAPSHGADLSARAEGVHARGRDRRPGRRVG